MKGLFALGNVKSKSHQPIIWDTILSNIEHHASLPQSVIMHSV